MLQPAAFAQPVRSGKGEDILHVILSLQFKKADSLLLHYPDDSDPQLKVYLENYNAFMPALVLGDRKSYDAYRKDAGGRAGSLRNQGTAGAYIRLAYMHLQSSLLSVLHEEFFDAARHYFSAFRYFRIAEAKDSDQPGIEVLKGTLDIVNGSVPSEYAWLFRILGMKGSVEEGFYTIEKLAGRSHGGIQLEACLVIMYASIMLDQEPPELSGCHLPDSLPGSNPLMVYVRAMYDIKAGRSSELVHMFEGYKQSGDAHHFYFIDLVEGEARLNLLDAGAGRNFEEFIRGYGGEHYVKLAWHKLSWHYLLAGDMQEYQHARKQVMEKGIAVVDADRQAMQEATDIAEPNTVLLKARLLFDGGQYKEALDLLDDQVPIFSFRDSVELIYRLGRIYERLEDSERALSQYKQVLEKGEEKDWYFAPNSALHMGLLYEQEGDRDQALHYFDKCLKINHSAYKKSIAYRARQGMERLER